MDSNPYPLVVGVDTDITDWVPERTTPIYF